MGTILATAFLLSVLSHGTYYIAMASSSWDDQDFFRHCPPSRCSKHGPEIRFPHRLQSSNTPSSCGSSHAKLICSGQDTILHHPFLGPCKVTIIDYKKAVMKIIPFGGSSSPCLLHKFNSTNLSDDVNDQNQLYFTEPGRIVRCSKEFTTSRASMIDGYNTVIADKVVRLIPCLRDTRSHFSYLVSTRLYLYALPLDCMVISKGSIPIPNPYVAGLTFKQMVERIINSAEITVDLGLGSIADDCVQCEQQGQRCAFSSQRNQTFCMHHGSRVKVIAVEPKKSALDDKGRKHDNWKVAEHTGAP
ncbi:hypothetical protein OsI_00124 [Oryza sativa Indica Group]|uniref:RING-type E3 ubiquitin transferase n=1 Tax=Oryza sativa subsp. indica TaxID=39946 RepID=B8ACU0_ORYSI|nr:hypothetical protein OsI_00124 [Oryza sativa Indica Group]